MTDAVCDNPIGLLSLEQALKRLLDQIEPVSDTDDLPLTELVDRILGVDVSATLDLPSFTNSAMDGYALRCTDGVPGAILPVAGVSLAGQPYLGPVSEGA